MYSPLNPNVFASCLAAATAGMAAGGRVPSDPDPDDYAGITADAGTFAQEMDTQWGTTVASMLDILTIQDAVFGAFSGRTSLDLDVTDYESLAAAIVGIAVANKDYAAAQGITPPAWNNGGGGGGTGYLPASPPADGTNNTLAVSFSGVTSWQPVGGYQITGFALSGSGVNPVVEVGSSIATINWGASFNFTPASISVTCTGKATQTPAPTGETADGTFTGPFTGVTNGNQVTVTITVIDPVGAPHVATASVVFSAKVVWGSVTSPVAGQGLWNALNTANNVLNVNGQATMAFASSPGQQQTFARESSLGTPTLKDSNGFEYTAVLLGTVVIAENGTSQSMNFYTVGNPSATFTWFMT